MININVWNICAVHNSQKYKQYSLPWGRERVIHEIWYRDTQYKDGKMTSNDENIWHRSAYFQRICLPLILPREVMNIIEISTRKIRIVWQTIRNPLVWDFVILIDAALLGTSGPQSYEQGDVILWRKWPINNGPGDRKNISAGLWAWYEQRARAATHY